MRLAAWNVARGLSNTEQEASPRRTQQIIDGIEQLDADVVILSEAYNQRGIEPDAAQHLTQTLGYRALATPYEDSIAHQNEPSDFEQHLMILTRQDGALQPVRLGGRNALAHQVMVDASPVTILGSHFEDRQETLRLGMAEAVVDMIDDGATPVVLAGDLNAMHRQDWRAHVLRHSLTRLAAQHAPHPRIRSLGTRLTEMADGTTIDTLLAAGLEDSDYHRTATMKLGGAALVQLDHIMTSRGIHSHNFQVDNLRGSDHRAISADIVTD